MIYGEIDLTKIPKELIKDVKFKDGSVHKLLDVAISERKEKDQYGYTHYMTCSKKNDDGSFDKTYIGNFKTFVKKEQSQDNKAPMVKGAGDLPF